VNDSYTRVEYGCAYGKGDEIHVQLDFKARTIEFLVNGVSQGVAFHNLKGAVYPAISLAAPGAIVSLAEVTVF